MKKRIIFFGVIIVTIFLILLLMMINKDIFYLRYKINHTFTEDSKETNDIIIPWYLIGISYDDIIRIIGIDPIKEGPFYEDNWTSIEDEMIKKAKLYLEQNPREKFFLSHQKRMIKRYQKEPVKSVSNQTFYWLFDDSFDNQLLLQATFINIWNENLLYHAFLSPYKSTDIDFQEDYFDRGLFD